MNDNPLGEFVAIATNQMFCDPAIDLTEPEQSEESPVPTVAEMLEQYRKTRNLKDLRLKTGVTPVYFKLKPLKTKFTSLVESMSWEQQMLLTFCAACTTIQVPDGEPLKAPFPKKPNVFGGHNLPDEDEWLDIVRKRFGISTIIEIASVAFQRARLPEEHHGAFLCPVGLPRGLSATQ